MSKQLNKSRAEKRDTIKGEIQPIFDGHTWQNYIKVEEFTCSVYPGSQWNDTTLFIWRRSPTLIPFIGTTGSGQLVKDTAKWMMYGNKNMEREKKKEISNYNRGKYQINLDVTQETSCQETNTVWKTCFFSTPLTFVFQPESSCRHADIREKVEVELVGGAVEQSWDRRAFGRRLTVEFRNAISSIAAHYN